MTVTPSFRTFVLEQLGRGVRGIRGRSMFGGVGIYAGEFFFALIADDTLYFKADESNRAEFEARGMGPFRPFGEESEAMRYYRVPDDLLDDAEALGHWAEKAIHVARRARGRPVPFDLQPTLVGSLVTLRPLRPEDHDELFAVAADPLIWEQHPDKTRSQPAGFQAFFQQALDSGGALLVLDNASNRVIGSSRFHGYDEAAGEVEIGWTFLAQSYWGGRYNSEMKRLMLEHAFRYVGRVLFLIDPANYRSQRAVEKIGAVRAGMRPDASGRPSYVFEIRRGELGGERSD